MQTVSDAWYLTTWNNPGTTFFCMLLFILSCYKMDSEYFASLLLFVPVAFMSHQAVLRRRGDFKNKFVRKERDLRIKAEEKIMASCSLHRSIATLKVVIVKGRDIRSREFGLPGQCSALVAYVSDQFLKTDNDKKDREVDPTHGTHELGTATHSGLTCNPVWKTMRES